MEEEGDGEDLTPFWVQNNANLRRGDRLRRGVSAVLFSSGLVVVLLLVTALFFMVFVVPSTLSFSANIFKPNSVKKSWDSLNIVLVLVAVIFGFLSRNKNEDHKNPYNYDEYQDSLSKENKPQVSNPSTPTNKWYNYPTNEGQRSNLWYEDSDYQAKLERKNSILRRNSSSYPDLREFSSARFSYGDYERRFYDDFEVDSSLVSDPGQLHRRHRSLEQVDYLREPPQTKTVIVDTLVSKSKQGRHLAPPLPPSVPPVGSSQELEENVEGGDGSGDPRNGRSRRYMTKDLEAINPITAVEPPPATEEPPRQPEFAENQNRAYEGVRRRKERSIRKPERDLEPMRRIAQPPPPPPPPPPPRKSSKSDRKRGGTTGSATKDFLNSLYHKKKKKQRQKSVDNFDSLLHEPQTPLSFQLPPPSPPPPPPPPPPSVLQNLFSSKKHKRKRTITVTLAPPHPPPPPPPPPRRTAAREPESKPKSQPAPSITHKLPKHIKMHNFDKLEETSNSGSESPMNRIPPPPPPPPPAFFKSPTWKFVVQGDYVRINSNNSSRSGSPDPDETDSDITPSAAEGGAVTPFHASPLFCPSPDVNTKAESFITNFRAKLKLEKIHSMKKKEVGLSTLGPGSGPNHN